MRRTVHIVALLASLLLAACSPTRQPAYADAYLNALRHYQGTTAVTTDMTDRFVRFFSHDASAPAGDVDPATLYGEPLYFSDTLLTTENRAAALSHLRRMHQSTESLQVTVLDRQVDGQDVYLIWRMKAVFTPVGDAVTSNTLGVTHLRFGSDGRIILQQDFWDSAEGLYRHVPVLGSLIDAVQSRFATDED